MQPDNLNVFDFDGTLIKVNSFREITKTFSVVLLRKLRLIPLSALVTWYILRRAGIISHFVFKRHVADIFEKSLMEREKQNICQAAFENNVNEAILERMEDLDNCIICTSAPFAYMSRVSFDKDVIVISSLDSENNFPDKANFGAGKIANLRACFKDKSVRVINFFTDSYTDDKALVDFSDNAFVVKGEHITKVK